MGQTFADIAGYRGTYVTDPLNINIDADGSINTINWVDTVPSNTTFRLESSIQINDGSDYTPWKQVFKNGSIPDIGSHTNMRNLKIKFRAIFNTLDFVNTPKLTSISMNFTPVIEFNNIGDIEATPEIWITKTGNGDFSLINTSDNNKVFKFIGLIDGETVYVNNYNQQIETTIPGYYRYGNFNDNFLNIPVGINVFKVQGSAKIQFRSEFKVLA